MTSSLLPAERGLEKRCSTCGGRFALDRFYPRRRGEVTQDGRRVRDSRCVDCRRAEQKAKHAARPRTNAARNRARSRAYVRLSRLVPELWERVFNEELEKEGLSR